jgi:predicted NBD/HSP70 family sugar kinase
MTTLLPEGISGNAAELGHMITSLRGACHKNNEGKRVVGCLEANASCTAVERNAKEMMIDVLLYCSRFNLGFDLIRTPFGPFRDKVAAAFDDGDPLFTRAYSNLLRTTENPTRNEVAREIQAIINDVLQSNLFPLEFLARLREHIVPSQEIREIIETIEALPLTAAEIDRASRADALAERIMIEAGFNMGIAVHNATMFYNPEIVVFMGGGANTKEDAPFMQTVEGTRREYAMAGCTLPKIVLLPEEKEALPGAIGAAIMAREKAAVHQQEQI